MRYAALAIALVLTACAPAGPSTADGGDAAVMSGGLTAQPWERANDDQCSTTTTGLCLRRVRLEFSPGGTLIITGYAEGPRCTPAAVPAMARWVEVNRDIRVSNLTCASPEVVCGTARGDGCEVLRQFAGTWVLRGSQLYQSGAEWSVYTPVSR